MATKKEKKPAASKTSKPKPTLSVIKNPLFEKHAFLIALGLTSLIAFIIFKDYLLMKNVYLFKDIGSDSLNTSYPSFCLYSNYLREYGFPSWSFKMGIGQNSLPFFLRDPFDIFIYLAPQKAIPYLIGWLEFAKVILSATIFFLYLRLVVKDGFACVVGTVLFAFGGFMILGSSGWYIFSSEVFIMALLLLAFEKLFQQGKWTLFPVAIALIGISQPFNLYVFGLFLFIYALMRVFEEEKNRELKSISLLFGKMIALGAIGLLMSTVFLIPNIIQLVESPRGSGISSYSGSLSSAPIFHFIDSLQLTTSISRFFSNDLRGTSFDFNGWYNYLEAPLFFSGVLTLILIPLGFFSFEKRRRKIYLIYLFVWILPIVFPYFRYLFWLFTGDYYRELSFFVSLVFIYVAVQELKLLSSENRKPNLIALGISAIILLAAVNITTLAALKSELLFFLPVSLIILFSGCIILVSGNSNKHVAQYAILFLLLVELSYMGNITTSNRDVVRASELNEKVGYNDYSVDAVNFLKSTDHSFYRIDKQFSSSPAKHEGKNDGMIQDYYGTSSYNSFNQINYVKCLATIGALDAKDETASRWIQGTREYFILEDLFSVKYILVNEPIPDFIKFKIDSLASFDSVRLIRNKFSLPLGFTYDHYMKQSDFNKISKNWIDISLLAGFVIDDTIQKSLADLKNISAIDTSATFSLNMYSSAIDSLRKDSMTLTRFSQTDLTGKINCRKKELLFLSMPYDKGWTATVNGKPQTIMIVDGGLMGLLLDKGENAVELKYANRYFTTTLICTVAGCILFVILLLASIFINRRETQKT